MALSGRFYTWLAGTLSGSTFLGGRGCWTFLGRGCCPFCLAPFGHFRSCGLVTTPLGVEEGDVVFGLSDEGEADGLSLGAAHPQKWSRGRSAGRLDGGLCHPHS